MCECISVNSEEMIFWKLARAQASMVWSSYREGDPSLYHMFFFFKGIPHQILWCNKEIEGMVSLKVYCAQNILN